MTILSIIALAILVIAILANLFTDLHPNVFYSAWLFALVLMTVVDVVQGSWWGIAVNHVLVAIAIWAWRGDVRDRCRKAKA